ncbi:MAG: hypothetical protein JW880_02275 [Candidatus Thermoplasmatota archaeon]|nr:hypothetical protein [Candidatus Thermoplasmatota archaeon]
MDRKRLFLFLFVAFAAIYYVVRIAIFYLGFSGEMDFEEEQSGLVEGVVIYSFLAIGVLGLAFLPWIYMRRSWGLWGTVAVSAYTMAFDVWAFVLVQSSAAAGVLPAVVIAVYLLVTRKDYTGAKSAA